MDQSVFGAVPATHLNVRESGAMNKLILADNQAIFRAGTAKILAMEDDCRIIAQCAETDRLLPALDTFRSSILLFASSLKLDPQTVIPRVLAAGSHSIVIAENGEPVQAWFHAGVNGAAHRNVTGPALIECVRRVGAGEQHVRANGVDAGAADDAVGSRVRERLTPKELKIVALIFQGCRNKEIALRLTTTEQVIKNYLRSIYDKTGVSDRLELALFTIHHHILAEAAQALADQIMQGL
jgi:DNA-binding NarL/FixJ family response regulator